MKTVRCERCYRNALHRPAASLTNRPPVPFRHPWHPLSILHRSVRPDRHGAATTRCGGLQSNPPSLSPGSWRSMGTGRSGSTAFPHKRRGPRICRTHRPEHGRAYGRQAFVFCRSRVGANPVGRGQMQVRQRGVRQRPDSLIHRHGTLNGIATAKDDGVHVAGGYIISNGRKSPYSSAGPARRGPLTSPRSRLCAALRRVRTLFSGIRAGGNRSGAVFRLIGTSTAAPQLARHPVAELLPDSRQRDRRSGHANRARNRKRGGGNMEPAIADTLRQRTIAAASSCWH